MKKLLLSTIAIFFFGSLMAQFDVTMNVDMTDFEDFDPAQDSVFVSGNIFGWPEPGTNMDLMLTQVEETLVYTITATLDSAQEVQYKYFSDAVGAGWGGGEWEGTDNRVINVREDVTVDDMWADRPSVVTFMVDMSWAADTVFNPEMDEVYMAGTINLPHGWVMPGEMENMKMMPVEEGSLMYTLDVSLYHGDYAYKYFTITDGVPSWDGGEWEGGDDRTITVDTTMTVEDYWGSLAAINDPQAGPISAVYPNPCNSALNVTFFENANDIEKVEVYNVIGEVVQIINSVSSQNVTINTSDLTTGLYFVAVHSAQGIQTAKFIKE